MLAVRRALFYHVNSFRYNFASCLSSISHKNQAENIRKLYKTEESSAEVDIPGIGESSRPSELRARTAVQKDESSVADLAKEGVVGAMETGVELGKVAKETVDGMLDTAKKTTESVKDSVADDTYTGGREDLRRRAGG